MGSTCGGDNLEKMTKNCMKIAKSNFLGQNSERDESVFWVVGGSPSPLPTTACSLVLLIKVFLIKKNVMLLCSLLLNVKK